MGCWLISLALMARETVAAASSSRFAATAGSMSSLSAWRKARRPISSAALRTAGLIGRPRRSTGLTRTPPSVWDVPFQPLGPIALATNYPNHPDEAAATNPEADNSP